MLPTRRRTADARHVARFGSITHVRAFIVSALVCRLHESLFGVTMSSTPPPTPMELSPTAASVDQSSLLSRDGHGARDDEAMAFLSGTHAANSARRDEKASAAVSNPSSGEGAQWVV